MIQSSNHSHDHAVDLNNEPSIPSTTQPAPSLPPSTSSSSIGHYMLSRLSQLSRHLSRPITTSSLLRTNSLTSPTTSLSSLPITTMTTPSHPPPPPSSQQQQSKIHTAACLIIGDEVLGGKTVDTNSAYLARFCFSLGIALKRVEVIADDESEIIEATRRMSSNYDFVVTSGGIGPTHDDITYDSIAKAFNLSLKLHQPALDKMKRISRPRAREPDFSWDKPSPALTARLRMVQLPNDPKVPEEQQVLFVKDELWVPISVVNGNIHILPGVPRLFEQLLDGLKPILLPRLVDPEGKGTYRLLFATPLAESNVAAYLTEIAEKVKSRGVKVGSYPRWGRSMNTVTLVGSDKEYMDSLIPEVEEGVQGRHVKSEDEMDGEGNA